MILSASRSLRVKMTEWKSDILKLRTSTLIVKIKTPESWVLGLAQLNPAWLHAYRLQRCNVYHVAFNSCNRLRIRIHMTRGDRCRKQSTHSWHLTQSIIEFDGCVHCSFFVSLILSILIVDIFSNVSRKYHTTVVTVHISYHHTILHIIQLQYHMKT